MRQFYPGVKEQLLSYCKGPDTQLGNLAKESVLERMEEIVDLNPPILVPFKAREGLIEELAPITVDLAEAYHSALIDTIVFQRLNLLYAGSIYNPRIKRDQGFRSLRILRSTADHDTPQLRGKFKLRLGEIASHFIDIAFTAKKWGYDPQLAYDAAYMIGNTVEEPYFEPTIFPNNGVPDFIEILHAGIRSEAKLIASVARATDSNCVWSTSELERLYRRFNIKILGDLAVRGEDGCYYFIEAKSVQRSKYQGFGNLNSIAGKLNGQVPGFIERISDQWNRLEDNCRMFEEATSVPTFPVIAILNRYGPIPDATFLREQASNGRATSTY